MFEWGGTQTTADIAYIGRPEPQPEGKDRGDDSNRLRRSGVLRQGSSSSTHDRLAKLQQDLLVDRRGVKLYAGHSGKTSGPLSGNGENHAACRKIPYRHSGQVAIWSASPANAAKRIATRRLAMPSSWRLRPRRGGCTTILVRRCIRSPLSRRARGPCRGDWLFTMAICLCQKFLKLELPRSGSIAVRRENHHPPNPVPDSLCR